MDAVLLASRVPYTVNMFVVGPFATRVSFASQQRRALTLTTAIHRDLKRAGDTRGLKDKKIGVVGAGLAGLTCAVAASAFGAKIEIFEKETIPLALLSKATHREVHPTINFWPIEDIEPTTLLPFFNWYHSKCDQVAQRIRESWTELCKADANLRRPNNLSKVVDIQFRNNRWRISIQKMLAASTAGDPATEAAEAPSEWPSSFDLLILATGFGPELFAPNSNTPSYWNSEGDSIKYIVEMARLPSSKRPANPCSHYVVSGTGDGGTIEVLRLLYADFQAGGFEAVTSNILQDDADLRSEISRIESDVQRMLSDMVLHKHFPLTNRDHDDISNILWERYIDLVRRRLRNGVDEFASLFRTTVPRVVLLGQRPTPIEFTQAPYHKLFLTYSVDRGLVEFYQLERDASVSDTPPDLSGARAAARATCELYKITPKDIGIKFRRRMCREASGDWHIDTAPGDRTFLDSLYISRHGYKSPVEYLGKRLSRATPTQIRKRQSLYADQDWLTMEQFNEYADNLGLISPRQRHDWAKQFQKDVIRYFETNHCLTLKSIEPTDRKTKKGDKEYCYILSPNEGDFDRAKYERNLSILPNRFFGVPIRHTGDILRSVPASGYGKV